MLHREYTSITQRISSPRTASNRGFGDWTEKYRTTYYGPLSTDASESILSRKKKHNLDIFKRISIDDRVFAMLRSIRPPIASQACRSIKQQLTNAIS